jgi:acyl transferase domain-containing protein
LSIQPNQSENQGHDQFVAVIGMSGRFPGAESTSAFWKNLVEGVSGVTNVTPRAGSSLPSNRNFVAKAAVVKNGDHFDAKFFGIYPKQAVDMDPQHRLFLETAWHAMEDAGYIPDETKVRVGVFAGCHMNTYIFTRMAADAEFRAELADSFPGGSLSAEISNDKDYLSTRVAYQLNLRGPAVAVQSACSTSLVAIAQACENLVAGSCDMAISGGVTVTFPQQQGYLHTEDSILSPDGSCRTFDANACGTIFGDGVGAVVLKRLSDAIADRDDIYAVIKGWGVNNDGGEKNGYTAPSVSGQSTAIRLAHRRAGITADTITYVEAHGTGTLVGDPIEVQALTEAFRDTTDKKQFCRIASLKTNVGHLDVAAGVTSVIKTSLALRNRQIPPMMNFTSPNPKIDFENSPFVINTKLTSWETNDMPRRAGVSSFGVGGTNAHLVMEEAPVADFQASKRPFHLIRLSARSIDALDQMSDDLANHLVANPQNFADVCHTLQVGRKTFRHRRIVVAKNADQASQLLSERKPNQAMTVASRQSDTPVVFMFPGQGSQHLNMARDLYESESVFAEHLDACAESVKEHLNLDLRSLIFADEGADNERLHQTEIAQPALFVVSYALGRWWQSLGVQPTKLIGHSVGEFAAAAIAGVMSMEDAARLVAIRGRLMQALPSGAMMAVQMPENELLKILPSSLEIAAINGPAFCVVSGTEESVEAFARSLEKDAGDQIAFRPLKTSHAFHSRMMDAAIEPFEQEVRKVKLSQPNIDIVSSVTGRLMDSTMATNPTYWARQIREPVRFSAAMENIFEDCNSNKGEVVLLEVGPNQALSTLSRQQPLDKDRHHIVSSLPHVKQTISPAQQTISALGQLWLRGASVDWDAVYQGDEQKYRRRVHLPKYRFQREQFTFKTELEDREIAPVECQTSTANEALPLTQNTASSPEEVAVSSTPQAFNLAEPPINPPQNSRQSAIQALLDQQMELMNRQMEILDRKRRQTNNT